MGKGTFRYTKDAPVTYASSLGVERTHCRRCGSPISCENSREFELRIGTFDDLAKVTPTYHCFAAEQLPWIEIADALPRYSHSVKNAMPVGYGPPQDPKSEGSASNAIGRGRYSVRYASTHPD